MKLLCLLFLLVPNIAFAEGAPHGWFEPRQKVEERAVWQHSKKVMIKGENLKGFYSIQHGYPPEIELCFFAETMANDFYCIKPDDPLIQSWTDNAIHFSLTDSMSPSGFVTLRYAKWDKVCRIIGKISYAVQLCKNEPVWQTPAFIGNYALHPEVTSVIEISSGLAPKGLAVDHTYEVRGHWFGRGGTVYLGKKILDRTDIVSWQPTSIVIKPTRFAGKSVAVDNFVKRSAEFVLSHKKARRKIQK